MFRAVRDRWHGACTRAHLSFLTCPITARDSFVNLKLSQILVPSGCYELFFSFPLVIPVCHRLVPCCWLVVRPDFHSSHFVKLVCLGQLSFSSKEGGSKSWEEQLDSSCRVWETDERLITILFGGANRVQVRGSSFVAWLLCTLRL